MKYPPSGNHYIGGAQLYVICRRAAFVDPLTLVQSIFERQLAVYAIILPKYSPALHYAASFSAPSMLQNLQGLSTTPKPLVK